MSDPVGDLEIPGRGPHDASAWSRPLTCQELTVLFGMDVVPSKMEALWSKAKRLVAGGWLAERQPGWFTLVDASRRRQKAARSLLKMLPGQRVFSGRRPLPLGVAGAMVQVVSVWVSPRLISRRRLRAAARVWSQVSFLRVP